MARVIDADNLVEDIKSEIAEDKELYPDKDWIKYFDSGMRNVIRLVKRLPIQDPVKHGHWIVYPTLVSFLRCSQCHNGVGWHNDKKPNYCPHCGARMDGDAND